MAVIICPQCGSSNDDAGRSVAAAPEESMNGVLSSQWSGVGIRVAQASGMVSAQAECSPDTALRLMKEHAEATDISLTDIAVAVLERRTRFG
jgi:ANTAR domain